MSTLQTISLEGLRPFHECRALPNLSDARRGGFLVKPRNAQALADAMIQKTPDDRLRLEAHGTWKAVSRS